LTCQSEAALLRRCGIAVTRMRYEDFVSQPRGSIEIALAELGVSASPSSLAHIGDNHVVLGASHGLSGNPSRFQAGDIELRADEAWRSQMSRRHRAMVMAIGFPHMIRHRSRVPGAYRLTQDQSDRVVEGGQVSG
jgi:hypothetical protein